MATMRDVARVADVSVSTVSHVVNGTRVVNEHTRQRVLDAIEELGWRHNTIARALARGGTASVGLAITAISNEYFGDLLSAIERAVTAAGSTILLAETRDDPEREYLAISTLVERRVDGLIVALGPEPDPRVVRMLTHDVPTVLVDRESDLPLDFVGSANRDPMAGLVDHLLGHGHTRIGLVTGRPGLPTTIERYEGYVDAVRGAGLTVDDDLVVDGGSDEEQAKGALDTLLALPQPPTAVVTANNQMTVGALRRLRERGLRAPDDLALGSFDDFKWADLLDPPLTAVHQPWARMGETAVRMLLTRIADRSAPLDRVRVDADLRVRRTCGCGPEADLLVPAARPGVSPRPGGVADVG